MTNELKDRVDSWMYDFGVDDAWAPTLCSEAKEIIKDQQARIEELETDGLEYRKSTIQKFEGLAEQIDITIAQTIEPLKAREKVLEEALQRIRQSESCGQGDINSMNDTGILLRCKQIAFEALQTKPTRSEQWKGLVDDLDKVDAEMGITKPTGEK